MQKERIATRISPDILDTIGRSFRFKHSKGVAELLKNSLDQYLRLRENGQEPRTGSWPSIISLIDGSQTSPGPNLIVIDFGGTTYNNVKNFFLHWGDSSAATLGRTASANVTGGHGNGGKFYMREMFKNGARLLTWRSGKVSSLIVDKRKSGETGEWEQKDESMSWREAMTLALSEDDGLGGANTLFDYLTTQQRELVSELDSDLRGFTVIAGRRADQKQSSNDVVSGKRWDIQRFIDEIRDAPQARRPIRELSVAVFLNGSLTLDRLTTESIDEDVSWPSQDVELVRSTIEQASSSPDDVIGTLTIRKSVSPLTNRTRYLNRLFINDKSNNPIASYEMSELSWPGHSSMTSLFQAELKLNFADVDDLISNDREKLVDSNITRSLLKWTVEEIWQRIRLLEEEQRTQRNLTQLQAASILNDVLNQHAQQFLKSIQTEILVDLVPSSSAEGTGGLRIGKGDSTVPGGGPRIGPTKGGDAGEAPGPGPGTDDSVKSQDSGSGSEGTVNDASGSDAPIEVPGSTQSVRRSRFPQVLLSGLDLNPATSGESKLLSDGHPPLYQDDEDKTFNVWWINTEHPYAKAAMQRGGSRGSAFKNYQLFMFRDVVQREHSTGQKE